MYRSPVVTIMTPETLTDNNLNPDIEAAHMWRRLKIAMKNLFATTPRQQTADQLAQIRDSHDEITRELVNLIDLGKPPADWKPPQNYLKHPRDLL